MANTFFKDFKMPKVDFEAMMAAHRKNMDALSKAHHSALDAAKDVSKAHQNYLTTAFSDMKSHFKELSDAKTIEEKIEAHARRLKDSFEKAITHSKSVTQTCTEAHKAARETLQARFKEGTDEIKKAREQAAKKTKH